MPRRRPPARGPRALPEAPTRAYLTPAAPPLPAAPVRGFPVALGFLERSPRGYLYRRGVHRGEGGSGRQGGRCAPPSAANCPPRPQSEWLTCL